MTAYTGWFDYVIPDIPGITNTLAEQAIRNAVIDFCRRTLLYRKTLAAISIVGGTATYTVTPDANTLVSDFLTVLVNGKPIDPQTEAWLDQEVLNWRTTATGPAKAYISPANNQITLVPKPSESIASGLVVAVAQRPTRASTECPDWLMEDYAEEIAHGAKARLFAMKRKPWSDPGLSKYHMGEFNAAIGIGAVRASQARTRTRLRTAICY